MACTSDFIDFICSQIAEVGIIRSRKMFGDYMIYVNEKPVILACDNIAYVKVHPAIDDIMTNAEKGIPYDGAKEHYILNVEHKEDVLNVVKTLEQVLPYPKSKKKVK